VALRRWDLWNFFLLNKPLLNPPHFVTARLVRVVAVCHLAVRFGGLKAAILSSYYLS